jgi:hypothetical protein
MNTENFTTTAYTVRDPGNGKPRRYEGEGCKHNIKRAEEMWTKIAEAYPTLTRAIVPDHFVQEYCQRCDSASWSGAYGPSESAPAEIMLKLLERSAMQGHANFLNGKA